MKIIALTGGIGCGKSTVSRIFHDLCHWKIIDADRICHELYEQKNVKLSDALTCRWGRGILNEDGCFLRSEIARIVFENRAELDFLNRVLHPLIFDEVKKQCVQAEKESVSMVVLDAPLLYECSWNSAADKVIAVWAPFKLQYERLLERGWNEKHILARLQSQMSADEKMSRADYALINSGSMDFLKEQVLSLVQHLETSFLSE